MPLRIFKCSICGFETETLGKSPFPPKCAHDKKDAQIEDYVEMDEVLTAPEGKMRETIDASTGKTRLKDQMKILKERSRNHARDYEADDLIQKNRDNGIMGSGFLKSDGQKRRKIDDL